MPSYVFQDFLDACGDTEQVYVTRNAQDSARADLKLKTNKEILSFICNGGLENLEFENSKPWENNQDLNQIVMVDAYHFTSGSIYGYIAFLFNPTTGKWFIKSFKADPDRDPRNMPLQNNEILLKLKNQLIKKREEK